MWKNWRCVNFNQNFLSANEKGKDVLGLTYSPTATVDLRQKYSASLSVLKKTSFKGQLKITLERQHVQLSLFIKLQALESDLRAWLEHNSKAKKLPQSISELPKSINFPFYGGTQMGEKKQYWPTNVCSVIHLRHPREGGGQSVLQSCAGWDHRVGAVGRDLWRSAAPTPLIKQLCTITPRWGLNFSRGLWSKKNKPSPSLSRNSKS